MKLTLIKPNICCKENSDYSPSDRMEPLALAALAGLTPEDVELKLFDDRLESIPYEEPTDLIAISVETFAAKRAYQIATEYRKRDIPVVLGGYHPTLVPEEALEYADTIVVGEAEAVWPQLIKDAKEKKLRKIYRSSQPSPLNDLKFNRDVYKGKRYLPVALVQFGRGCKYACDFCCVTAFYNHNVHHRLVADVAAEIEKLERKTIFFVDDNIAANIQKAKELFKALIPLKIRWVSQISLSFANDDEFLKLMAKSGCLGVLIGFESLDKSNLKQMNKAWNVSFGSYGTILEKIRDHGLAVYGTFVFGYDNDNQDTIREALEFSIKHKLFIANFNHLIPYPGTPLYNKLKSQGRLLYDCWWLDPSYRFGHAFFDSKQMTAAELTENCMQARLKFHSCSSILKRALDFKANSKNIFNLTSYFLYNYVSRKEIIKKQHMALGGQK